MLRIFFLFLVLAISTTTSAKENPYLFFKQLDQKIETIDLNTDGELVKALSTYQDLNSIIDEMIIFNNGFIEDLLKDIQDGQAMRGLQLTVLHKSLKYFLTVSAKTMDLASQVGPDHLDDIEVTFNQGSEIQKQKNLLWYIAHMKNLNHFLEVYLPLLENKKLRILLNDDDSSFGLKANELKDYIMTLISKKSSGIYGKATSGFLKVQSYGPFHNSIQRIKNWKSTKLLINDGSKGLENIRTDLRKKFKRDRRTLLNRSLTHRASSLFGNLAGSVRLRKGHLFNNEELNNKIINMLKPLDIITEKTPFILTDKFIPGHFGHNAIWLGSKKQLISLGLWDHPQIIPLRSMIEKGYSVLETDRSGTHLKTIQKFMDVDWFGLVRMESVSWDADYYQNIYEVALSQLGKSYDFNFDVETTNKLVCSELLYQSFGEIKWPTKKYLNRITITPDNIASLSLYDNTPMSLIYYIKGNKQKEVIELDEESFARDLGFRKNNELSKNTYAYYEKMTRKCSTIIRNKEKRTICYKTYKHYRY